MAGTIEHRSEKARPGLAPGWLPFFGNCDAQTGFYGIVPVHRIGTVL